MRIKLHSSVGLITNSSSVVYTNQDSIKETKNLINCFFESFGIDKKADDIFYFGLFYDTDTYRQLTKYMADHDEIIDAIYSVMRGEIPRPDWLVDPTVDPTEDSDADPDEYVPRGSVYLWIEPKDDKYEMLGKRIEELLNSVRAEEGTY